MRLNLGCGEDIRDGWVNVDLFQDPRVVRADLDRTHWAWWADGAAQEILARHIFEHVESAPHFMAQCWRVLAPGGRLEIETPHWMSRDAYTDPTHRRFPTEHTFDYWVPGTFLRENHGAAYKRQGIAFTYAKPPWVNGGTLFVSLVKALE